MAYFFFLGRVIFGGFFVIFGIRHFTRLAAMAPYVARKGIPLPEVAVVGSGILAVLGGLSIMLGFRPRWGIFLLALFLIPVSGIMHDFWAAADPATRQANEVQFAKNVAILAGALMLLAVPEPWPWSVGHRGGPSRGDHGESQPSN